MLLTLLNMEQFSITTKRDFIFNYCVYIICTQTCNPVIGNKISLILLIDTFIIHIA